MSSTSIITDLLAVVTIEMTAFSPLTVVQCQYPTGGPGANTLATIVRLFKERYLPNGDRPLIGEDGITGKHPMISASLAPGEYFTSETLARMSRTGSSK